jgi:hypothetical protein
VGTTTGATSQFDLSFTDPSVKQFESVSSSSLIAPKSKVCEDKFSDKITTDGILVIEARGQLTYIVNSEEHTCEESNASKQSLYCHTAIDSVDSRE